MSVRVQAARAVAAVLRREGSLATALPAALEKTADNERALLQQLCYGTMRQLPQLQLISEQLISKPMKAKDQDIQALVLIGLYQLLSSRIPAHAAISETVQATVKLKKHWAKGLVNGVLRSFQRQPELTEQLRQNPVFLYAHPEWLIRQLQRSWPDHWQQILEQNNHQAPMTLRVNLGHGSREDYAARLSSEEINHRLSTYSPSAITLDAAADVEQLPGFRQGDASVQDEAAQLAADLLDLKPGQRLLDACAAPGGKTCHILETEPRLDQCVALDVSAERLERVQENLQRTGLSCQLQRADASTSDWWDGSPFDRILLDAPCSATGVIRRNPDIKYLRKPADISNLAALQLQILHNLWSMLAPGGRLVYATCSVLPDENEQVVGAFLQQQTSASEVPVKADWGIARPYGRQLFPQPDGHDGFYYAVMVKK